MDGEQWLFADQQAVDAYAALGEAYGNDWDQTELKWGDSMLRIFTKYIVSIKRSGDWGESE